MDDSQFKHLVYREIAGVVSNLASRERAVVKFAAEDLCSESGKPEAAVGGACQSRVDSTNDLVEKPR